MSILTTVNSAFKRPISEDELASFIKSGIFPEDYSEYIYTFFTEVPLSAIFRFMLENSLSLEELRDYYYRHVKHLYRNPELEEMLDV